MITNRDQLIDALANNSSRIDELVAVCDHVLVSTQRSPMLGLAGAVALTVMDSASSFALSADDMNPAALGVAFAWPCVEAALPFISAPMAVASAVKRSCSVIVYALAAV